MSKDNDDLINLDDFKSVEWDISLSNSTTGTAIKDGMRIYGSAKQEKSDSEDLRIRFVEFLDKGFVLEVPANSCSDGHNLLLDIATKGASKDIKLKGSAKVTKVEKLENKKLQIEVNLVQYDDAQWQAMKAIFSDRQNDILEFFKAVKGV